MGLTGMQWWTFGFHEMQGISWVAEELSASQTGLSSMELVSYSADHHQQVLLLSLASSRLSFHFSPSVRSVFSAVV